MYETVLMGIVLVAGFTLFYLLRARHIERMMKIEHGMLEEDQGQRVRKLRERGIMLTLLGLGLFLGYQFQPMFDYIPKKIFIPGVMFTLGGIGLVLISFLPTDYRD